jgi:hypothetical protein
MQFHDHIHSLSTDYFSRVHKSLSALFVSFDSHSSPECENSFRSPTGTDHMILSCHSIRIQPIRSMNKELKNF